MKLLLLKDKVVDLESKESFSERFLGFMTTFLGFVLLFIVSFIVILYFTDASLFSSYVNKYTCSTFEEQVCKSNTATLDYFCENICDNYDSVLISPIGIQSSIYDYYQEQDKQNPVIFSQFENGYNSWVDSGNLFNTPCFSTVTTLGIDTEEALLGKLNDISEGYIDIFGVDVDISPNTIYSVFKLEYGILGGVYCEDEDLIYVEGKAHRKVTDSYTAVKLDLSNPKYSIYLVEGSLDSFSTNDFKEEDLGIVILPFVWQSSGSMTKFAGALVEDDMKLNMFAQFGFSKDNHKNVETYVRNREDYLFYANDYSFVLVDNDTNLILAVGKN